MIIETLIGAGVQHIRFNALTQRACVKELKRIATAEGISIADDTLATIAESSHCDMFNAIQTLRVHVLGTGLRGAALAKGSSGRGRGAKKTTKQAAQADSGRQFRDQGLDLFHALGKILYNKRFNAAGERVQHGPRCACISTPVSPHLLCRLAHLSARELQVLSLLRKCMTSVADCTQAELKILPDGGATTYVAMTWCVFSCSALGDSGAYSHAVRWVTANLQALQMAAALNPQARKVPQRTQQIHPLHPRRWWRGLAWMLPRSLASCLRTTQTSWMTLQSMMLLPLLRVSRMRCI